MLKKLSKSRKKKTNSKLANSRSKLIKQPRKDHKQLKQHKQIKIPHKSNHHASTLTLLSHHNASQCSLLSEYKNTVAKKAKSKNRESSISMIYKDANDGGNKQKQKSKNPKDSKKSKKNSSVNPNSKSKKNIIKISPEKDRHDKNQKILKQNPSKKSKIHRPEQLYERINAGLFKSKTNSEINFSNNSSVRQNYNNDSIYNPNKPKKVLTIDCSDEYILNQYFSNSRIKNHEKKRVQAAIKIQKIFRGYLTRKMLQQYIQKQQMRLQQLSRKIKYSSSRQSGNKDSTQYQFFQKSKSNKKSKIKTLEEDESDEKIRKFTKKRISQDMFLQSQLSNKNQISKQQLKIQREEVQEHLSIQISLKNSRKQIVASIDHGSLEQQSSIYGQPQDSLSKYLPFDQKYININQSQDQSFVFQKQPSPFKRNMDSQDRQHQRQTQQYYTYDQVKQKLRQMEKQKQQKSQQYFKYTPAVSSYASKSKAEDPIPTDFSEKRVQQFQYEISVKSRELQPNYNKKANNSITSAQYSLGDYYDHQNMDFPKNIYQGNINEPKYQGYKQKNIKSDEQSKQEQKMEKNKLINKQQDLIKMLKKEQKQKWGKIIQMLNYQIIDTKNKNEDNQKFMNMILQFSKKNKQQLQKSNPHIGDESKANARIDTQSQFSQIIMQKKQQANRSKNKDFIIIKKTKIQQSSYSVSEHPIEQQQQSSLSRTKQQIQQQSNKNIHKNEDMPLIRKKLTNLSLNLYGNHIPNNSSSSSSGGSNKQNYSLFEKTQQLKVFYRNNMPAYPIQQMIQIREKALEKREKQMVNKLNQDMYNTKLTHEEFISRLSQMQQNFQKERQLINKARMQIFIGHRATHKLMQDSFKDAWYLGFKIPFSQSLKDFKGSNHNVWIKQIIVDQLKSYNCNLNASSSSMKNMSNGSKNNIQNPSDISALEQSNKKSISQYIEGSLQKQSEKKRQDLSISLPHQDSSLTIKAQSKSHQVSQQSVYSQDISYNEGEVEIHNLGIEPRTAFIFDQDFSEEDDDDDNDNQPIHGFRKVNPDKIRFRSPLQYNDLQEGTLLLNPDEQEEIDNQVMRKISLNQRKRPDNQYLDTMDNLRRSEMTPRHSNPINRSLHADGSHMTKPKSEVYRVDLGSQSGEDEIIFNEEMDPSVKQITEEQVIRLIWETAGQIYMNTFMRSKFCKNRSRAPEKITDQQRNGFIRQLQNQIPPYHQLQPRLNQKMTASRLQLLKFMRISFETYESPRQERLQKGSNESLEQSSQGLEQIGKFEHILPSDTCLNALNKYMQRQQAVQAAKNFQQQQDNDEEQFRSKIKSTLQQKVSQQCIKKVTEREINNKYNQKQKNQLRKQIQKIQFHCIFDSFNQILMRKRLKFQGYSGIGLNELTMIMSKENFKQLKKEQQFAQILQISKKQLNQLVSTDKSSNEKLLLQNYQRLCQNDSQWIYYTEQALSFALQFVFMLEDEIFFEETAVLFKRLKGF